MLRLTAGDRRTVLDAPSGRHSWSISDHAQACQAVEGVLAFGVPPLYVIRTLASIEACVTGFEAIRDDFASLDDWEDRYRYVIELGHTLEPLGEAAHNEINKVRGCVSQVWLEREARTSAAGQTILHFRGDSDSHLVRGLIAISIALFSDRAPKQILAVDALGAFRALGLEQHLTPQRSNGVRAMIERMRSDAAAAWAPGMALGGSRDDRVRVGRARR